MTDKRTAVLGIYSNRIQTEGVVNALMQAGFSGADISLLMPEDGTPLSATPHRYARSSHAASAAVSGGPIGGALGLLAGIGSLDVRGLGPLITAGPIVATLAGVGGDGGLHGVLMGMGVPEYDARRYESRVKRGAILLCAHGESAEEARRANAVFEHTGAEDIATASEPADSEAAAMAGH